MRYWATSQIASDFVLKCAQRGWDNLHLFARRPQQVLDWLESNGFKKRYPVDDIPSLGKFNFQSIVNFIGVGDPQKAAYLGGEILDVTLLYDQLVLDYLVSHPECKYLFLSSGAAYCSTFEKPANKHTISELSINNLKKEDWYGIAKLHAECRHRSYNQHSIVDVRVFNYFSRWQDINSRFLMTDIVRHIIGNERLVTSANYIVRDYIAPDDFHSLVELILKGKNTNTAVDCYSKGAVDKPAILEKFRNNFGLEYINSDAGSEINATGPKKFYYSTNMLAEDFGYAPTKTSIESLVEEADALIEKHRKQSSCFT